MNKKRICNATGKRQYEHKQDAYLELLIQRYIYHSSVQRIYICEFCNAWHLTKQDKRHNTEKDMAND